MYVNGDGKMIMVSVIVPVYKVEQYLEKCVNSIREQTYKNIEIILHVAILCHVTLIVFSHKLGPLM